jgi:uncharacterized membrane protein YbhN (UPF0104 family)
VYYFLLAIAIIAVVLFLFRKKISEHALIQKIIALGVGLLKGILSVKDVENKWSFAFHTLLIWVMYFCTVYFLFFAFETTSHLGVNVALALFVIGSLGMVAPVPGGVGAFHFLVTQGLILYGLTENVAASFAGLAHAIQMVQIVSIGGITFFIGVYVLGKTIKA